MKHYLATKNFPIRIVGEVIDIEAALQSWRKLVSVQEKFIALDMSVIKFFIPEVRFTNGVNHKVTLLERLHLYIRLSRTHAKNGVEIDQLPFIFSF